MWGSGEGLCGGLVRGCVGGVVRGCVVEWRWSGGGVAGRSAPWILPVSGKEPQYDFIKCHTPPRKKCDKPSNIRSIF